MGCLKGRVAVVTGGGGSGIGHGISQELAGEGAHVVIVEIDLASAESVAQHIRGDGGQASVVEADVSRAEQVRNVMERVIREHQRLDILVNSAGIGLVRAPAEATEEEFDRLMAIDLRGVWLCCKYAIPQMQRQKSGAIINIASVHGQATLPNFGLYAGMKAGVAGFTRGIAVHYGADGIRANTVAPGLVDGPQTREVTAQFASDVEEWMRNYVHRNQALPRLIQARDIGRTVVFLASDDSRSITGAEIPVDAGSWALLAARE